MGRHSFVLFAVLVVAGAFILSGCPKKPEETSQAGTTQSTGGAAEKSASAGSGAAGSQAGTTQGAAESAFASSGGLKPVHFDFDKSFIRADAKAIMQANAEWLKAHPGVHITIDGNCDERGTIEYNQALGQRRAASAKKYLTDMGVSAHRIRLVSYGKEKPVCSESAETCWQENRRDDFVATN